MSHNVKIETKGKHYVVTAYSLAEFTAYSRTLEDHQTAKMSQRMYTHTKFFGDVKTMDEVHALADKGMERAGITALAIAQDAVRSRAADIQDQQVQSYYDMHGADVDVDRYLTGEPECMIDYQYAPETQPQQIVTLAINVMPPVRVSGDAVTKHGQALVALAEAIDYSGLQCEIWADISSQESRATGDGKKRGHTSRYKVLIKRAGDGIDPGRLMFVLTHPAFSRALVMNADYAYPKAFYDTIGPNRSHGKAVADYMHPEDYPDGTIYIPALMHDKDAGTAVDKALRELGLVK